MAINDAILPEFDQEMALTRKTLERVPEDNLDWQPHKKSMSLARLAGHLAELPSWGSLTLQQDSFDLQPPGAPPYQPFVPKSRQEILDLFDKNIAKTRQAVEETADETWAKPWTLLLTEKEIFTMPRIGVFRSMILSHNIHHRAQLGVYLRLHDIPVPSIYGPSADEQP